jgi:hypothetical protein
LYVVCCFYTEWSFKFAQVQVHQACCFGGTLALCIYPFITSVTREREFRINYFGYSFWSRDGWCALSTHKYNTFFVKICVRVLKKSTDRWPVIVDGFQEGNIRKRTCVYLYVLKPSLTWILTNEEIGQKGGVSSSTETKKNHESIQLRVRS